MRKHVAVAVLLIGILSALTGCSSKDQPKEQANTQANSQATTQSPALIKEDLAKYTSSITEILKPMEVLGKLTEELAKAKTEKAYIGKLKKDFIPLATSVLTPMENLKPATKEVQDIHNAFLASFRDFTAGLQEMAVAVEKKDDKLVKTAEAKINGLKTAYAKLDKDSAALAGKLNPAAAAK